jgi:hypothetical protein
MWFIGILAVLGTPLGIVINQSSDWHQNLPLDMLSGYLIAAAMVACVMAISEGS